MEFSNIGLCAQCTACTQRKLSLVELGGATYIVVALLYTMYSRLLVYTLTVGASSSAQCLPTSRCVHFCGWLPPSASSSAYQLLWVYTLLVAHQCLLASRPEWLERPACSGYQHAHTHRLTCPAGQVGQGSSKWFWSRAMFVKMCFSLT